jgi:hypothetical protein
VGAQSTGAQLGYDQSFGLRCSGGMRHAMCDRTCTSQPEPRTMSAESILWMNAVLEDMPWDGRTYHKQILLWQIDSIMRSNSYSNCLLTSHTLPSRRNQIFGNSRQDPRSSIRIVGKGLILSVTIATTSSQRKSTDRKCLNRL